MKTFIEFYIEKHVVYPAHENEYVTTVFRRMADTFAEYVDYVVAEKINQRTRDQKSSDWDDAPMGAPHHD